MEKEQITEENLAGAGCGAVGTDTENGAQAGELLSEEAERPLTEKERVARIRELRKQDYLERVEECRKVYLEKRGRDHQDIELEMRARGWPTFSRRCLYRDGARAGWPERFGWNDEIGKMKKPRHRLDVKGPCVNRFHRWLKRVSPTFNWDWPHLKLLAEKLQDVTDGKTKRLMIFMPPRHGKSELATIRYPAYRLREDPSLKIIKIGRAHV